MGVLCGTGSAHYVDRLIKMKTQPLFLQGTQFITYYNVYELITYVGALFSISLISYNFNEN